MPPIFVGDVDVKNELFPEEARVVIGATGIVTKNIRMCTNKISNI